MPLEPATREGDRLVGPFSALWYLVFVIPLFLFTPDRAAKPVAARAVQRRARPARKRSVKELVANHHGQIALFLLARMLYADGLGAVFAFGGIYAATVFGWGATELGLFGIILTIAGTFGAVLGGVLDDRAGSKWVIVADAGSVHRRLDRRACRSIEEPCAVRASGRAEASRQRAVLLDRRAGLSRLRHPDRRSPLARSRPRAARCSRACARPARSTEFFGFFSFSGKITAFAAPLAIGVVTPRPAASASASPPASMFLIAGLLLLLRVKER